MSSEFCFLKGLVDCNSGRIQDCNIKRVRKCPLEEQTQGESAKKDTSGESSADHSGKKEDEHQEFCFLKGLVDCNSGRIQDCNMKRVRKCPMEEPIAAKEEEGKTEESVSKDEHQEFCFLKGLVDCNSGRIQDCNMKRVRKCPMEEPIVAKEEEGKPEESVSKDEHQEFCFLKGLVDCNSGRIQDCNMKRVRKCPMEEPIIAKEEERKPEAGVKEDEHQEFCFLKGLVDCNSGRIQDCNIKRVRKCPLDN